MEGAAWVVFYIAMVIMGWESTQWLLTEDLSTAEPGEIIRATVAAVVAWIIVALVSFLFAEEINDD